MPSKAIALFVALLLLWSGLATVEAPVASAMPASNPGMTAAPDHPVPVPHEGSVAHHHLDDLPSQVQLEPATDHAHLPPRSPQAGSRSAAHDPPPGPDAAAPSPPWLAGLLRPPCRRPVTG